MTSKIIDLKLAKGLKNHTWFDRHPAVTTDKKTGKLVAKSKSSKYVSEWPFLQETFLQDNLTVKRMATLGTSVNQ